MVHAAHRGASQYLGASRVAGLIESKDVVDPAIVDGGFAGIASQITKVLQQIAVRLAIVLQVVSVEMRLVPTINFEVEITGDKNNGGAGTCSRPVNQIAGERPSSRRLECIRVRAHQHDFR